MKSESGLLSNFFLLKVSFFALFEPSKLFENYPNGGGKSTLSKLPQFQCLSHPERPLELLHKNFHHINILIQLFRRFKSPHVIITCPTE